MWEQLIFSYDDEEYADTAWEGILGQVMGKQSADSVDTVSGCTYSSQGFIQALECIKSGKRSITHEIPEFYYESFMSASDRWCRSWLQLHAAKKDSDTEKDQQIASLTTRVEALEKQQDEILSALEEAAKAQEEAKKKAEEEAKNQKAQVEETSSGDASEDAKKDEENTDETEAEDTSSNEDSEELVYKNGTYTGDGQGFGGNIQVQVTLENDTITDIQVVSAPGEDSAYLSQGQGVISTILAAQSTDVDTISGATFSSTGIINAVNDALGKAENQ